MKASKDGVWRRGISLPTGVGSGEGLCLSPENVEILSLEKPHFGAFYDLLN